MNQAVRITAVLLLLFAINMAKGQEYDGFKGKGTYQPYDKTYISPVLKAKHGASFGIAFANVSPLNTWDPFPGVQLGYNYLLLYQRKRVFGIKEVWRDEVKIGFGAHFYYFMNGEWYVNANVLRPFIKMRGKIISLYFLSEFGIGFHHAPQKMEDPPKTKFNITLEAFRIRFGKSPLNLSFRGHYDASNALLSKNRMDLAFSATLNYYFYKRYKKPRTKK